MNLSNCGLVINRYCRAFAKNQPKLGAMPMLLIKSYWLFHWVAATTYCGGKYVVLLAGRVPEGGHIIHPASDHIRTSPNQDSANIQTRKHFQFTDSANAKDITSRKEKAIPPLYASRNPNIEISYDQLNLLLYPWNLMTHVRSYDCMLIIFWTFPISVQIRRSIKVLGFYNFNLFTIKGSRQPTNTNILQSG